MSLIGVASRRRPAEEESRGATVAHSLAAAAEATAVNVNSWLSIRGSAANEGSSAMAAASSGGEASELIGETAVEDDEPKRRRGGRSKKSGGARRITKRGTTDSQDDG